MTAFSLLNAVAAYAQGDCDAGGSKLQCKLNSILHALYSIAAVLAVVLLIVVVFAVRAYRRNKNNKDGNEL